MQREPEPSPPPIPPQADGDRANEGFDAYQKVADRFGFVPTLRLSDHLIQFLCAVVGASAGAIIGGVGWGWMGLGIGAFVGVVAATFLSGAVLMVLGWVRK